MNRTAIRNSRRGESSRSSSKQPKKPDHKKVHPHLLRHTVATFLLERGMLLEQIQKFSGHTKIETTQIYAKSSTEMITESFQNAFSK